jgi:hypothetical protein
MARYVAVKSILLVDYPLFFDKERNDWIEDEEDATHFDTEKEAELYSNTVWRVN